jgi:hypothetical protein
LLGRVEHGEVEIEVGILAGEERFELADAGPLDGLAGNGAFEDVMGLVGRIDGQLEGKAVLDVDMRKDALFVVLLDALSLDVVDDALLVEDVGDRADPVAKQVQVDVAAGADVPGHDAADEAGAVWREQPHQAQRLDPHLAEVAGALAAFVEAGEGLDFVADFRVRGQIRRLHPALADAVGSLLLGAVVLGFFARVHKTGSFPGDLPPELTLLHRWPLKPEGAARGRRGIFSRPRHSLGCRSIVFRHVSRGNLSRFAVLGRMI